MGRREASTPRGLAPLPMEGTTMIRLAALAIVAMVFIPRVEAGELAVEARIDEVHNEKCFQLGVVLRLDSQQFESHGFQNVTKFKVREITPGLSLRRCSDVEREFLVHYLRDVLQNPAERFTVLWQYAALWQYWRLGGVLPILTIEIDKPVLGKGDCLRIRRHNGKFSPYDHLDLTFGDIGSIKFVEPYDHRNRIYWDEQYLVGNQLAIKENLVEKMETGGWLFECRDVENKAIRARLHSLLLEAQRSSG